MSKFHITITDTEENEILVDADTSAIIGAVDAGESTNVMSFVYCDALSAAATAAGAMQAAKHEIAGLPRELAEKIEELIAEEG